MRLSYIPQKLEEVKKKLQELTTKTVIKLKYIIGIIAEQ